MKSKALLPLLLAVAVFSGWIAYTLTQTATSPSDGNATPASISAAQADVLRILMNAPLVDMTGKQLTLKSWEGKILVVNYWATWCPPCRAEMPGFSRLAEKYAGSNVQFVGIGVDQADNIRQFSTENPVHYPLIVGSQEHFSLAASLGNPSQGMPFTLVIDATGHLHSVKLGRMTESDLEQRLLRLTKPTNAPS